MAATKVSLRLLVDRKANRVLFAEAGKDFVDFLFNIFCLPLGTVLRILTKGSMVGCLGNLYGSIENLNESYMQQNINKDTVLTPKAPPPDGVPLLLPNSTPSGSSTAKVLYKCSCSYHNGYADDCRASCPSCGSRMSTRLSYVAPPPVAATQASSSGEGGGFVKGVVTYMVMDDLTIQPMSTISSITLLNKFNVKEVNSLEDKVVALGVDEGVKLLKASLQSKRVLTELFLGQKIA